MASKKNAPAQTFPPGCRYEGEKASWIALNQVMLTATPHNTQPEVLRSIVRALVLLEGAQHGLGMLDELRRRLGPNWAICAPTPANKDRYSACITAKQYGKVQQEIIEEWIEKRLATLMGRGAA